MERMAGGLPAIGDWQGNNKAALIMESLEFQDIVWKFKWVEKQLQPELMCTNKKNIIVEMN